MDNLTNNLNAMIYHQRQAERSLDAGQQDYHHREALRHRAEAMRLDRQVRMVEQSVGRWLNLN